MDAADADQDRALLERAQSGDTGAFEQLQVEADQRKTGRGKSSAFAYMDEESAGAA